MRHDIYVYAETSSMAGKLFLDTPDMTDAERYGSDTVFWGGGTKEELVQRAKDSLWLGGYEEKCASNVLEYFNEVPTPTHATRPWSFDDTKGLVVDGNGSAICAVIGGLNRNKESAPYVNGRILAAALDLREALELAEGFISGFEDDEAQDGMDFLLSTIRAAISKATGQPTERLFIVTEVVKYEVNAISPEEAEAFIEQCSDRDTYVVSVSERDAVEKGGE